MKNKKKWLALFLAAGMTISLAGCGGIESTHSTPKNGNSTTGGTTENAVIDRQSSQQSASDTENAATTASESTSENATTAASGTASESASTAASGTTTRGVETSSTASGTKVKVDYSKYKAGQKQQAKYTRRSQSTVTDLQAADDYGAIYPFAGQVIYSADTDGYSYVAGYKYGFADAAGEIICDPVYDGVYMLYYTDPETGDQTSSGFYLLIKTTIPEQAEYTDEDYCYDYESSYAVASADGCFVTDCIYSGASAYPGGLILTEGDDGSKVTLVDETGKTLLTEKNLNQISAGDEIWLSWAGLDHLFILADWNTGLYYYIDQTGKTVMGPYTGAGTFSGGMAQVDTDGEEGIIDTKGNYIFQGNTDDWLSIDEGYIIVQKDSSHTVSFYDSTGKLLMTAEDAQWGNVSGGYLLVDTWNNSDTISYAEKAYDSEGNLVEDYSSDTAGFMEKSPVFYQTDNSRLTMTNLQTGAKTEVAGTDTYAGNLYKITGEIEDFSTDGSLIMVTYREPGTDEEDYIFHYEYYDPETLEKVYDAGTDNQLEILQDRASDENYLVLCTSNCYKLLDENYKVIRTYSDFPYFYKGAAVVTGDQGSVIYNADGEIIFYYPLVSAYDD